MEATALNLLMPHNYIKKTLKDKTKILWIIEKDSKIKPYPSCLGNISNDSSVTNMKKNRELDGSMYDYSIDYNIIGINDFINNHKCFMKK